MTMKDHNKILATIFFILGVMQAFAWIAIGGWYGGEWMVLIYSILYMFTGFQMHNEREGAKALGIIASLLCLPSFPIGTAIGVYGMWYFIYGEKDRL